MEKREWIRLLQETADRCEENRMEGGPMWDTPLVGFAAAGDPLFRYFYEEIGEGYLSPAQAFGMGCPDSGARDEDLTVISLAFPHREETRAQQRKESREPSLPWRITRNRWSTFIRAFYDDLQEPLAKAGIQVVIPDLLPGAGAKKSEKHGYASNWSHRHTAFAAGLGTFGLSEGLITRNGMAARFATLIAEESLEPDARDYTGFRDWCGFDRGCGVCIDRCPAGAISREGHDKIACARYLERMQAKFEKEPGLDPREEMGCGLCQSRVPCEKGPYGGVK